MRTPRPVDAARRGCARAARDTAPSGVRPVGRPSTSAGLRDDRVEHTRGQRRGQRVFIVEAFECSLRCRANGIDIWRHPHAAAWLRRGPAARRRPRARASAARPSLRGATSAMRARDFGRQPRLRFSMPPASRIGNCSPRISSREITDAAASASSSAACDHDLGGHRIAVGARAVDDRRRATAIARRPCGWW